MTDEQRAILDLERQFWRTAGAKEDAIRAMGLTPTRYYQLAQRLIWTDAALAVDPVTVKRLRRIATRPVGCESAVSANRDGLASIRALVESQFS